MNRILNDIGSLCRAVMMFVVMCLLLMACSDADDGRSGESVSSEVCRIVVIAGEEDMEYLKRTGDWAMDNIAEAQRGMEKRVEVQMEYKNQNDDDFGEYVRELAADTTVAAIIGPSLSKSATMTANALCSRRPYTKPMITPACRDLEFQRRFSGMPCVINMAESEIAQIEALLSGIASRGYDGQQEVMLLTGKMGSEGADDAYVDWFGFIAEEYGLKVDNIFVYENEEELRRYVHEFCGTDWHCGERYLVFNPSSADMALALDDEMGRMRAETPKGMYFYAPVMFCSDAFVSEATASAVKNATYEGVDLYGTPESGFCMAYRLRFGEEMYHDEAQFYDAVCLIAYAKVLAGKRGMGLVDAIGAVTGGRDGKGGSWLPDDMATNFRSLAQGMTPDIDGVSSLWTFDENTHTCVTGSTYRRWLLRKGEFVTTEYVSTEGSRRSSSAKNMWEWTGTSLHDFGNGDDSHFSYPELKERWALLVAASSGWTNYRFQSDVFAIYQLLKRHGYDDDHIVLVCEDDLAGNANNPYAGELRVSEMGDNVYDAGAIDYRLSALTPADIGDILQGRESERLQHVIKASGNDNVFVFWSSHGAIGAMDFGGSRSMSYHDMRNYLEGTPHRKMMVTIEACYSGGLGELCQGLPGTLFLTAANAWETSHADVWSEEAGVYLSNGFTYGFQEAMRKDATVSIRDLYYTLAAHTSGSHVRLYNVQLYGNVYTNTMTDFFQ